MRRFGPLLLATVLFGAALPLLAAPESAPEDLDHNRRLLERYRAEPEHYARLLRDLRAFQALPPERQERMRQLDRELHEQDPATQDRLWTVMERYADWVARLPEADQKRIDDAADRAERLAVVTALRQQEWIDHLPKKDRDDLAALAEPERTAKIAELRKQERQHRQEWLDWAKSRPEPGPGSRPNRPARLADFPPEIQNYIANELTPKLTDDEKTRLNRDAEAGRWPALANTVLALSDAHRLTPPGPYEIWNGARGLPRVSNRPLMEFAQNELSPEEKADLNRTAGEDRLERREILKQLYFRKHPDKIDYWRRLDKHGK